MRVVPYIALLILTCVVGATSGCGKSGATAAPSSRPATVSQQVEVIAVAPQPWQRVVRSQGSLVADEISVIGSRVAGRVAESPTNLGDRVTAGSVLAKMDTTDFASRLAQAEASLSQACAAVGLKSYEGVETLNRENAPPVRQEKAVLAQAKSNLARSQRLRAQQAITEAEIDQLQAAVNVAEARYQSALNSVEEKIATIHARKAEADLARQDLTDAVILAPFDGAVEVRHVSPGTYVQVGDPIATLVRTDPIRFRGQLPERAALRVRIGLPIEVTFQNDAEARSSSVRRISPVLDEETRSLTFEADLPNADGRLRPGVFATGVIELSNNAPTLAAPMSAVSEFAGVERVWRVEGGEAREAVVRTGERQAGLVEILEGLKEGDLIVVVGGTVHGGEVEISRQLTFDDVRIRLGDDDRSSLDARDAAASTSD